MRRRSGVIKAVKTHKVISLTVASLIVLGGVGTGVALSLQPDPVPKKAVAEQSSPVEHQPEVTEPVAANETTTTQPQEEQPVEPIETVQSVLEAQGWDQETMDLCIAPLLANKPDYFKDVETTKKTVAAIKVFTSPCYLIVEGSRGTERPIISNNYWHVIEQKVGL